MAQQADGSIRRGGNNVLAKFFGSEVGYISGFRLPEGMLSL
jgi:hypothetical protein